MSTPAASNITSVLKETRTFPPPADFAAEAHVKSMAECDTLYQRGLDDPEGFWAEQAKRLLHWFKPWDTTLVWKEPFAQWFVGGELNASDNCLDRHMTGPRKNKAAIVWEGEPGDTRVLTYQQLHHEVCKFANALKGLGLKKGDRVTIYMPMIPEAAFALLACARIGAIHSVVFGGFSPDALAGRIQDCDSTVVITADEGRRAEEVHRAVRADEPAARERRGREREHRDRQGECEHERTRHRCLLRRKTGAGR